MQVLGLYRYSLWEIIGSINKGGTVNDETIHSASSDDLGNYAGARSIYITYTDGTKSTIAFTSALLRYNGITYDIDSELFDSIEGMY